MKLEFCRQIFENYSNTKFNENPFSGSELVHAERRTDMEKPTVACRSFAKAPKKGRQQRSLDM